MPHHLLLATGFVEQLRSDTFVSPGWSLAALFLHRTPIPGALRPDQQGDEQGVDHQ